MKTPKGKFMGTVKVGEKGQIVIPKDARTMFGIEPGDTLLLMADIDRGIAIVRNDSFLNFAQAVFDSQKPFTSTDGKENSKDKTKDTNL